MVPCSGVTHLFYPERGNRVAADRAKAICGGCTARLDCLEYALRNNEEHGVWGGTTVSERRVLRRNGGYGSSVLLYPPNTLLDRDLDPAFYGLVDEVA